MPQTKSIPLCKRVAIIGGGPSGLFAFKRLLKSGLSITIDIFEAKKELGVGMPYGKDGACEEHVTNVSSNEIPDIVTPMSEWIFSADSRTLTKFNIDPKRFNEYKVLPRLFFGQYLNTQFNLLLAQAKEKYIKTTVHFESIATDIIDQPLQNSMIVELNGKEQFEFDHIIVATGHHWPTKNEGSVPGYFDSPYPPHKIASQLNHPVAIRGASLTAVDAVRTLARKNGKFIKEAEHELSFHPADEAKNFKIVMHSINGLLPGIRFHLEDSHLGKGSLASKKELNENMKQNDGFLSLNFVFEKDFKEPLREKDPSFYHHIKDMAIEEFVKYMMEIRKEADTFALFKSEYIEAEQSIRREESVHWKEMLAILSFAMNYPAKHFSAEDMIRLKKVLMPLISIVIAFVPQGSCEELIALYDAGVLDLISVDADSRVDPNTNGGATYSYKDKDGKDQQTKYNTFIDCIGQPHLSIDQFPFKSLVKHGVVSPALLQFRSPGIAQKMIAEENGDVEQGKDGNYYLKVPGITITDNFQAVDIQGVPSSKLFIMSVPYIGGYNPDYSGLDFCEEASKLIIEKILESNS